MSSEDATTANQPARNDTQPVELIDPDDERYRHVIVTEVKDANAPRWSRKRAIMSGAGVGAFFGIVFFAAYAMTSAWICSARLDCGHWAPIAIVSSIGALAFTLGGATVGYMLHKTYRLFKVA